MYRASLDDFALNGGISTAWIFNGTPTLAPMEGKSYTLPGGPYEPSFDEQSYRRYLGRCSYGTGLCHSQCGSLACTQILEHLDGGLRLRAL